MDKFFKLPFSDFAGGIGFVLVVLAVIILDRKVGITRKIG